MPDSKVYFGQIETIQPPRGELKASTPGMAALKLGGQTVLLNTERPSGSVWARMIELLQSQNMPAYAETDEDNVITLLYMPIVTRVMDVQATAEGGLQVVLSDSHAIHHLRNSHAFYRQFADMLQDAKASGRAIMLTATRHTFEIIDVRPVPPGTGRPEPGDEKKSTPAEPDKPVTPERAAELFKLITTDTCIPCASKSPCIPFNYPYDGCWVRAHLMCYKLTSWGETPQKVWIGGSLKVHSRNSWECKTVGWGWHVAATLPVLHSDGIVDLVFDPSLCDEPVTIAHWRSLMGPKASETWMRPWEHYNFPGDKGEASEKQADTDMKRYRLFLDEDCEEHGPPPYCN